MKNIQAYIAADGTLHRTPRDAAVPDLVMLGLDADAAALVIANLAEVQRILTDVQYPHRIHAHYEVSVDDSQHMAAPLS